MNVHVKAKAPLARRCRCGYCFDAEGQELVVSERELAALTADPMLVVTVLEAPEARKAHTAPAADSDPSAPEEPGNAAPEGDTPEGEGAPEGDMPDGEAHA